MMLYEVEMEPCFIIDKTTTPDGYGGVVTTYSKGADIHKNERSMKNEY